MKISKISIAFLFISTTFSLFSQPNTYAKGDEGSIQIGNLDVPFLRVSQTSGNKIVGSIYLNEEWEQGTITDFTNKKKVKLLARFNAYHNEIEILKEKNIIALYPAKGIDVFLNGKKFIPLKLDNKKKPIFAEILVNGKHSLYKVYDINIKKAPTDAKLLNIESVDRVVITSDLYFQEENGNVSKLPSNKKSIKQKLPSSFLDIAKKEKLSLKKEDDLVMLFSLVNSQ